MLFCMEPHPLPTHPSNSSLKALAPLIGNGELASGADSALSPSLRNTADFLFYHNLPQVLAFKGKQPDLSFGNNTGEKQTEGR